MPFLPVTEIVGKVVIICAAVVSIAPSWVSSFVTKRRVLIMDDGR